jgi:predicted HTH domain antitoxin
MREITLRIPEDSVFALKVPEDQAGEELRMAAAAKLFEIGRISSGAAAKLAGVPRTVFLSRLGDYGVDTFSVREEELEEETRLA